MNLHGVIDKVEALGVELEHSIAAEARKAWEFFKMELEKLRPHAHPDTGVIPGTTGIVLAGTDATESQGQSDGTSGAAPADPASPGASPAAAAGV